MPEVKQMFNGHTSQELNDIVVTSTDVLNKIMKLKNGKSPGNDNIIPEFLKEVALEISVPLCVIYNSSLRDGQVPLEWKRANVTLLFKKGSKGNPENYRPISQTSYIGKVLESILQDKMLKSG